MRIAGVLAAMTKRDVRAEDLLAWNEYVGKPPPDALQSIYDKTEQTSKTYCDWYWKSIKLKRRCSHGIVFGTLVLLICGTVLPVLAGVFDHATTRLPLTQAGVVALAVAGLLQVADRVFGCTSGWLRYMSTVMAMENARRTFELAWASHCIDKGAALDAADVKALFDLSKQLLDDLGKLQTDETQKWAADYGNSVTLLGDLIKSQKEAADKTLAAAQAAQDKAQATGAVALTLKHAGAPVAVKVALDDAAPQDFVGTAWAARDVAAGLHTVSVTTSGTPPITVQKPVTVPAGGVGSVEVEV